MCTLTGFLSLLTVQKALRTKVDLHGAPLREKEEPRRRVLPPGTAISPPCAQRRRVPRGLSRGCVTCCTSST